MVNIMVNHVMVVNFYGKRFIKLAPGPNVIKLFCP
jgi:hypothetical protein